MAALPLDPAGQLRAEKALLIKADTDIEQGRKRLLHQQQVLSDLQAGGRDTVQAARLVLILEQTLEEWERHRGLIEERVAYLERHYPPDPLG